MADFRAEWNTDPGPVVVPWLDPELGPRPSRLNPRVEQGHRRAQGSIGVELTVVATLAGDILAPLDGELDGELFSAFLAECPTMPPPAVTGEPGQSSLQRFTPAAAGHYTLRMVREGHGSIFLHVDVI